LEETDRLSIPKCVRDDDGQRQDGVTNEDVMEGHLLEATVQESEKVLEPLREYVVLAVH
jgi:hypothetical protein